MTKQFFCGIAYNVHDSSVSFAIGNHIVLVLEAERVFRIKKKRCNKEEMEYLILYGLSYLGKNIDDITHWAMATHQNPLLQEEDVFDLHTGLLKDPYWKKVEILGKERGVFLINHHLSHAATYLMSNFHDAIIVTCDGGGDYSNTYKKSEYVAIYRGNGNNITRINLDLSNAITAKFYGACSFYLYKEIYCEGKMMALATYGTPKTEIIDKLENVLSKLGTLPYQESVKILRKLFPNLEGRALVSNRETINFSASVQKIFSDRRVSDIADILNNDKKGSNNLVMAGGASLNIGVNTSILKSFPNMNHFIAPCCDDTGQSLGAMCILISQALNMRPSIALPYLGMGKNKITYDSSSIDQVVDVLLKNGVAILHNGKAEIGPRALGNRSFVARPDIIKVKQKLSNKIKQRASYRPIAPVILEEKVNEYLIGPASSPFMLYSYDTIKTAREKIKGGIHYDGSTRAQTINRKTNSFLYDLIKRFGDRTGIYALLNTSLNLKGDPIANRIEGSLKIYNKIQEPKIMIYNGSINKLYSIK